MSSAWRKNEHTWPCDNRVLTAGATVGTRQQGFKTTITRLCFGHSGGASDRDELSQWKQLWKLDNTGNLLTDITEQASDGRSQEPWPLKEGSTRGWAPIHSASSGETENSERAQSWAESSPPAHAEHAGLTPGVGWLPGGGPPTQYLFMYIYNIRSINNRYGGICAWKDTKKNLQNYKVNLVRLLDAKTIQKLILFLHANKKN